MVASLSMEAISGEPAKIAVMGSKLVTPVFYRREPSISASGKRGKRVGYGALIARSLSMRNSDAQKDDELVWNGNWLFFNAQMSIRINCSHSFLPPGHRLQTLCSKKR
jgi:hypothetical protein